MLKRKYIRIKINLKNNIMKAKEFLKQMYPNIEIKNKFGLRVNLFSVEEMIEFAERFAELSNKKQFVVVKTLVGELLLWTAKSFNTKEDAEKYIKEQPKNPNYGYELIEIQ